MRITQIGTYADGRILTYETGTQAFTIGDAPVTVDQVCGYSNAGQIVWSSPDAAAWFDSNFRPPTDASAGQVGKPSAKAVGPADIGTYTDGRTITCDRARGFAIGGMPVALDRMQEYDRFGQTTWASDDIRDWFRAIPAMSAKMLVEPPEMRSYALSAALLWLAVVLFCVGIPSLADPVPGWSAAAFVLGRLLSIVGAISLGSAMAYNRKTYTRLMRKWSENGPAIMLRPTFNRLPMMVKQQLVGVPTEHQRAFLEEFAPKSKDTSTAYMLCFLFGLHYAYLGRWDLQILFWITAGGLGVWWIADFFRVQEMVKSSNKDAAAAVMSELTMTAA